MWKNLVETLVSSTYFGHVKQNQVRMIVNLFRTVHSSGPLLGRTQPFTRSSAPLRLQPLSVSCSCSATRVPGLSELGCLLRIVPPRSRSAGSQLLPAWRSWRRSTNSLSTSSRRRAARGRLPRALQAEGTSCELSPRTLTHWSRASSRSLTCFLCGRTADRVRAGCCTATPLLLTFAALLLPDIAFASKKKERDSSGLIALVTRDWTAIWLANALRCLGMRSSDRTRDDLVRRFRYIDKTSHASSPSAGRRPARTGGRARRCRPRWR